MQWLRKFPVAKNSMDKKGGFKVFRPINFFSQCRTLSKGNTSVLCFRNFAAAKKFMDEEGAFKIFRRRFFCLRVSKKSVGQHFCAVFQKICGSEKDYG